MLRTPPCNYSELYAALKEKVIFRILLRLGFRDFRNAIFLRGEKVEKYSELFVATEKRRVSRDQTFIDFSNSQVKRFEIGIVISHLNTSISVAIVVSCTHLDTVFKLFGAGVAFLITGSSVFTINESTKLIDSRKLLN